MNEKLQKIEAAIELAEKGRGNASQLLKASPIEISIYNAFTNTKRDLIGLRSTTEDALGIYMKKENK